MFGRGRYLSSEEWEELGRETMARISRRLDSVGYGVERLFNTLTDEDANSINLALRPTDEKVDDSQLKPEKIDYQVQANARSHHTDDYDEDAFGLVVRRGQVFNVVVTFDRAYDPQKDQLILQLTFGSRPDESKNTLIRVKESDTITNSSWCLQIKSQPAEGRKWVNLEVMSPADALVGEYKVFVETKTKKSGTDNEYLTFKKKPGKDDTIIVLFNAWCQEDAVYIANDEDRQEYVLNSKGKIWVGGSLPNTGSSWNFGQFEEVSLKTCLLLLDKCQNLKTTSRGDPVMVSRFMTKMVNSSDDNGGILVGNWTEKFAPHKPPWFWSGSVQILEKYLALRNKRDGVKFGQCWVYSGLVTTLGRAIGIPTRSVTNVSSGRDTDSSTTIDYHFDEEGIPIEYLNRDFVWNFHVWNECFFKRQDLPPKEYDGWQAIDATPQEKSQGIYCCGPSPLKAIKEGMVYIPYDTRFVFGEVNGDRVKWGVNQRTGEMRAVSIDKFAIGKLISTKAVGSNVRKVVTDDYKHKEGSDEERSAVKRAYRMSSRRNNDIYNHDTVTDVEFEFVNPDPNLMIGADVDVKLKMTNKSTKLRTINVSIITKMAFYTGIIAVDLDKLHETYELQHNEQRSVSFPVPAGKYIGKAPPETNIRAYLSAKVKETQQVFYDVEVIELKRPDISFQFNANQEIEWMKEFDMTLHLTNPLNVQLENCVFNIETARHVKPDTITKKLPNPVEPQKTASVTVTLKARRRGWKYVTATFSSDQLIGVDGEVNFYVN